MCGEVILGTFNSNEVISFQPFIYSRIRLVVGVGRQHAIDNIHDSIVDLQFCSGTCQNKASRMKMKKFCFRRSLYQCRMYVGTLQKFDSTILRHEVEKELGFKFKYGALVWHSVYMG